MSQLKHKWRHIMFSSTGLTIVPTIHRTRHHLGWQFHFQRWWASPSISFGSYTLAGHDPRRILVIWLGYIHIWLELWRMEWRSW